MKLFEVARDARQALSWKLGYERRAAALAGLGEQDLEHLLVTGYGPSAPIGRHKDRNIFARYGTLESIFAVGRFAAEAEMLRLYRSIATMNAEAPCLLSAAKRQPGP